MMTAAFGEPAGRISRRRWLAGAVKAAAAMAASGAVVGRWSEPAWCQGAAEDSPDLERHPWIDAHSHVWTHDVERFPLAQSRTIADLQPEFTERELLEVAHRNGVGRVVLIHHHPFYGWDNAYLVDVAARMPKTFRVVGTVDNLAAEPERRMRELLEQHVTGFRITSSMHGARWLDGGMDAMWRTAAETGQNICGLINPDEIAAIDALCSKHAGTPVVIDHFARIGADGTIRRADLEALCRMARHQRVKVKVSAFYALGAKSPPYTDLVPMIRRLLDAFGPSRLMWASDSPYQLMGDHTYEASIELVRDRLDFLSSGDRDWLLRKTAEETFFYV